MLRHLLNVSDSLSYESNPEYATQLRPEILSRKHGGVKVHGGFLQAEGLLNLLWTPQQCHACRSYHLVIVFKENWKSYVGKGFRVCMLVVSIAVGLFDMSVYA